MVRLTELPLADTRARLIEAAAETFYTSGYSASMDAIAACAGVSKQTLYNHFTGKESLFVEVIRRDAERMITVLGDKGDDLRTRLIRFACAFRTLVFGPRCIALYRTVIAEATRFPEMMQAFHESGPAHTTRELANLFEAEMAAHRMRRDGHEAAQFAADMLLGMLTGSERTRFLLGVENTLPADDALHAERIIDAFLRIFAPASQADATSEFTSAPSKEISHGPISRRS